MDNVHNDKDLIQLAGYHAYRSYKKRDEIEVNNKLFFVENVIKDPDTGFEALVVRNITPVEGDAENHDGELIIVYVGSRPDSSDWGTNIDLLKDIEPEQMKQAVEYFEKMEEKYGEISAITGNSLGGALANRVTVEHRYVKSVTLNPAILPSEFVEEDIDIAIFAPGILRDVQLYNIASVSILTEMGMVFEDIIRHLSSNRSRAIEETINVSKDISINMDILKRDIDRGTI